MALYRFQVVKPKEYTLGNSFDGFMDADVSDILGNIFAAHVDKNFGRYHLLLDHPYYDAAAPPSSSIQLLLDTSLAVASVDDRQDVSVGRISV